MRSLPAVLATSLLLISFADSIAQPVTPATRGDGPPTRPAARGEPWTANTLYEYINAGDSQPHSRNRTQQAVCVARGTFGLSNATSTDLPEEYRQKCWVDDKRAEANRQQVKYVCTDGMTAEAVTRREADGSFGSKFVISIPGKGGIAVTRTFRRATGTCDLSKISPEVPLALIKPDVPDTK